VLFLKFLIGSLLAVGAPEGGWFPVEKVQEGVHESEDDDRSIWVLFTKQLGEERIQVRFPDEPTYIYSESGGLEVSAERNGDVFSMTVLPAGSGVLSPDLLYAEEGRWVREHFVESNGHFFRFKTVSNQADSTIFREFISSFSIDKSR
jgi:hypothetical protein